MIIGQENIVIKQHVSIIVMVTEYVMLIEVVIVQIVGGMIQKQAKFVQKDLCLNYMKILDTLIKITK